MNSTLNYLKNSTLSPNYKPDNDTSKEEKKKRSLLINKEEKKKRRKEENDKTNVEVDFESNKKIEKLEKYGTLLKPSLIKKIKVYSVVNDIKQQRLINNILEEFFKNKF